jgi:hypothetical protein
MTVSDLKYINDWDKLTEEQKQGIIDAIGKVDSGKEIPHKEMMENTHKKYSNASVNHSKF